MEANRRRARSRQSEAPHPGGRPRARPAPAAGAVSEPIPATVSAAGERWKAATRHLRRADPFLKAIIDRIGPCLLEPRPDRFGTLVRAIVGQQISARAAASINQKLMAAAGLEVHSPARLIELGEGGLRPAGLSAAKARYVLNLAEAVASGAVPLDAIDDDWDDARITRALTSIKGVGAWTAEMFLIFSLNRPDVLPAGDMGVRAGLKKRHNLAELPTPRECFALAEHWRPYRSIASWYLWKGADTR